MTLPHDLRAECERLASRYPQPRSAVIPCLWAVQEREGWISAERLADIGSVLGMEASEVESVATFYSMFALEPRGEHFLLVCTNVSCALAGADRVADHLERRLGPSGSTSADNTLTWEKTVECLGGCGQAPCVQLDHRFLPPMSPEGIDGVLDSLGSEPSVHREKKHG